MKKISQSSFFFLVFILCRLPAYSAPPLRVGVACIQILTRLDEPAPELRLELAKIPETANIDVQPAPVSFEKYASILVTINADYNQERIRKAVSGLQAAHWSRLPGPESYSKTRVRVIGPWEVIVEFGISKDISVVRVDDTWYRVDIEPVEQLISLFSDIAETEVRMASGKGAAKDIDTHARGR